MDTLREPVCGDRMLIVHSFEPGMHRYSKGDIVHVRHPKSESGRMWVASGQHSTASIRSADWSLHMIYADADTPEKRTSNRLAMESIINAAAARVTAAMAERDALASMLFDMNLS